MAHKEGTSHLQFFEDAEYLFDSITWLMQKINLSRANNKQ